jgi:hypothetical protein
VGEGKRKEERWDGLRVGRPSCFLTTIFKQEKALHLAYFYFIILDIRGKSFPPNKKTPKQLSDK